MNIESLIQKANLFQALVIDSGLKRDLSDYFNAIQQGQNRTIIYMKPLAESVLESFQICINNGLDKQLKTLLKKTAPFLKDGYIKQLETINSNPSINANEYFNQFNTILNQIIQDITQNENEINSTMAILKLYSHTLKKTEPEQDKAIIAIILRDLASTTGLKEFAKVLSRWNRIILVYHQLIHEESPSEILLEGVQEGSIEINIALNVDVAIHLTDVILHGMDLLAAYLLYKTKDKETIDVFQHSERLQNLEREMDKVLLEEIKQGVAHKIQEQHNEKKTKKESVEKSIDDVSSFIVDHLIKGNEVKLLTKIEETESSVEKENFLREKTVVVQKALNQLSPTDKTKLIELYTYKGNDDL